MELTDQRFIVPFLPPRHVSRPRLLGCLDQAAPVALTLLSAGAGAGKTALLSEWARRQETPVAWLALTRSDDDPRRFWRLFLEAGRATGQTYLPSAWTSGGTVELLESAFGRPAESPGRLVVVLDDAHLLTDPEILEGLDRIVGRWSHRVRLLVAARSDPPLPLHRYRLGGQMQELRAADLAMTSSEARDLLDEHGVSLPDSDLRTLTARTEGWSAGLRLAALRMEGLERPADFVALLAMDRGSIGEYLTEEVLTLLPERMQRLLVMTSFLDDVTGPLAEAVTGIDDCGSLLRALARTNSFVIPVDPAQTTFRYHPLFREMLRYLAHRQPAGSGQSRCARAAGWYRAQGDLPNALRWSVQAGDATAVRSLLVHGGLAEAFIRDLQWEKAWLLELARERLPDARSPTEQLEYEVAQRAIVAIAAFDPLPASAELAQVPDDRSALRELDPQLQVTALLAELMLARKAGVFVAVDAAAERLLSDDGLHAAVDAVPGLRPSVLLVQARARFSAGRLPDVDALLRRALSATQADRVPAVELEVLSMLTFAHVSAGRLRHAEDAAVRAEALLVRHPRLARPVILDLALARRAHLEANFSVMAAAMRRVRAVGPVYADAGQAATVGFMQAALLAATGDLAQARAVLRDSPAMVRTAVGLFGVLRDRELAAIETALGRPRAALQILGRHRGTPQALGAEVAAARAHLALGDLDRAAASVRAVTTTPSPFVDRPLLIDAELCDAEIALRRGDDSRALEVLDRALQIAAGEIVLPFVRATGALGLMLARHPALAARWPVPVPAAAGRPPEQPVPGRELLPDELTHREQAVLRLMATSMAAAEIADELCLSVNTVKTHLAAIYRKLSVSRRRDAVFRARELELL